MMIKERHVASEIVARKLGHSQAEGEKRWEGVSEGDGDESLALMTRGQIISRYVSSCARNLRGRAATLAI